MTDEALSSRRRFEKYKIDRSKPKDPKDEAPPAAMGHPGIGSTPGVGHKKRDRSFLVLLKEFLGLSKEHIPMLCVALAGLSIASLLRLIPMYGMKIVVDNVLGGKPMRIPAWFPSAWFPSWIHLPTDPSALLAATSITMICITSLSLLIGLASRWQATRIGKRVGVSVRRVVFDHAVRLPLHRVYALKSGGAASVLREDAGGVGDLIFGMIYNPWQAIIQLAGGIVILTLTDWRLFIGSLVVIPIVFMTHRTWIAQVRPLFSDIRASRSKIDGHATEVFGGMRVVRAFARERSESTSFTRGNHYMARQEILTWWWMRGVEYVWSMLIPTSTVALLWYGGTRILLDQQNHVPADQALTTGDLMMFIGYLASLLGPLEALASSATTVQNSLSGLDRVLNIMSEPIDMPDKPDARKLPPHIPSSRITVRNVGYAYPKADKKVLSGVSFDAEPGEMIALVGPSGAGKTTLCNLIARFYDPVEGSITFDGTDIRDIQLESYRSLLGIVEQDTFLFDGTIAENIAYGRREATREQIIEAARKANAHEFIEKIDKTYDARIGERGVKLSGGQRQRLTIARAILADPRILILDEATSNLDTESERLIQQSLRNLMVNRTSFVIAHRLSTIAHANRILVIDHGGILEMGTHAELMEKSGRYRQMVEFQTAAPAVVEPAVPAPELAKA